MPSLDYGNKLAKRDYGGAEKERRAVERELVVEKKKQALLALGGSQSAAASSTVGPGSGAPPAEALPASLAQSALAMLLAEQAGPGARVAPLPSVNYSVKVAARIFTVEEKARRAVLRRQEAQARRGAKHNATEVCEEVQPPCTDTAGTASFAVEESSTVPSTGSIPASAAFSSPVDAGCPAGSTLGTVAYPFDGTEYGPDYLILMPDESVRFFRMVDEWCYGRRVDPADGLAKVGPEPCEGWYPPGYAY